MKKTNRLAGAVALAASAALVLAGCSSNGENGDAATDTNASGETTTLKVATIGIVSDGGLMTGIEQGFFEEEGLEIETSIVANPPAGLAAVQSGQVDIAYAPSIPLLNGLSQGLPLQVVAAADGYPDDPAEAAKRDDSTALYGSAANGITSLEELEGKTIAVPARKAQLEVNIAAVLADAGVDPNTVNWVVLDFTSAVAALQSGNIDAAGLVNPFTSQAEDAGNTHLASPGKAFFEHGAVGLWTVGESTVEEKADAIAAFQRAINKTNEYANENPEEATQAGIEYTESPLSIEQITIPYWPTSVHAEDIARTNSKLVSLGFMAEELDLDDLILTPGS